MIQIHKGLKKRLILFVVLNVLTYVQVAWRYPLAEVTPALDECKSKHWSQLNNKCKMTLPIVRPSDYDKIDSTSQTRNIITMLHGATYTNQRDYSSGGSPGIDIATAKGTPVYSIGDGIVIYAGVRSGGDGNSVSIAHQDKGNTIYSHYSHLDTIEVFKNQKIKAGYRIGTVGNSGRTIGKYGNHLDFQIDIKDTYSKMFGYYGCPDGYIGAVNGGGCRQMMTEYTIDPLKFLADRHAILPNQSSGSPNTGDKQISDTHKSLPQVNKNININESQTKTISDSPIVTTGSTTTQIPNSLITTIAGLTYQVDGLYPQTMLGLKKKLTITIQAKDSQGKIRQGILPDTLDIITSNRNITSTIETINYIDHKVEIVLTAKKIGTTNLIIQAGDYTLAQTSIIVK